MTRNYQNHPSSCFAHRSDCQHFNVNSFYFASQFSKKTVLRKNIFLELKKKAMKGGCDLLSKCIFDLLINTLEFGRLICGSVVICFQNVSLTY